MNTLGLLVLLNYEYGFWLMKLFILHIRFKVNRDNTIKDTILPSLLIDRFIIELKINVNYNRV
jgi:hypothetical protein